MSEASLIDAPMSDTSAPAPGRAAEMLAELAELDLSLARHVHAQALAATEPEVINALGRTYQRVARSLRQTLALRARLERQAAPTGRAAPSAPPKPAARDPEAAMARAEELEAVGKRLIYAEYESEPADCDAMRCALDDYVLELSSEPGFGLGPLDADVARLADAFGVALTHLRRWRDLPDPPWAAEPAPWDEVDADSLPIIAPLAPTQPSSA